LQERPQILGHGVFTKLMNMAALGKMTTEERIEYMGRVGAEWKEYTTRETLKKIGRTEGRVEGRTEGEEIGENNSVNILKAFLHQKLSPEQNALLMIYKKMNCGAALEHRQAMA